VPELVGMGDQPDRPVPTRLITRVPCADSGRRQEEVAVPVSWPTRRGSSSRPHSPMRKKNICRVTRRGLSL
jgi:hypothetical protein